MQDELTPVSGFPLTPLPGGVSPIVFGGATFSYHYQTEEFLKTDVPQSTLTLALRYGITTIDTSPYYGDSERIIGSILRNIASEFPRSSYKLITKCGRYGPGGRKGFDYTPSTIRSSVKRSLERLGTEFLDVVYLHDVDFVSAIIRPTTGDNIDDQKLALQPEHAKNWGLAPGDEGRIRGEGDEQVLAAISELRRLKDEGLIGAVGISAYSLPNLLRLALLILNTPPFNPLDVLLSFSQLTLQNSNFEVFIPEFLNRAKIPRLFSASPFNLGFLTPSPPGWMTVDEGLKDTKDEALELSETLGFTLPSLALSYCMRRESPILGNEGKNIPTVVGLSTPAEVHEAVNAWREVNAEKDGSSKRKEAEVKVKALFQTKGWYGWSWPPSKP